MQGLGDVRYHQVESESVGRGYHIYVRLPDGYTESEASYPTVYLLDGGNPNVVLCERGVRTFADHTRNTLDLSAVELADPSS